MKRLWSLFRSLLFGRPLPTARIEHEKLPKILALAVLAADNVSSVAYAAEEILLALIVAGVGVAFQYTFWIALAVATLLWIVTLSYRQIVLAYPNGGGAYIVSRENLGIVAAQVAGAALLIDYILTVAVSVSAGIAALISAFPFLEPYRVTLCVLAILFITVANLRGARESGALFAPPVYLFIFSLLLVIVKGIYLLILGVPLGERYEPPPGVHPPTATEPLTVFLLLHAFASGCSAMTGVEAISNSTTLFKPPQEKNAAITMIWMSSILMTLFLGSAFLAEAIGVIPQSGGETVISQIVRTVLGGRVGFYYLVQAATMVILILAANTSFAGFPRLAALQAADGFLPRQFTQLGDRLVYSNGIWVLGLSAILLVIFFQGDTHLLIPLYAVGVFLSFTLSQWGMVIRWLRLRRKGWQWSAFINGVGAVATGLVTLIFAYVKFVHGAWLVTIAIPALVMMFFAIHHHYLDLARQLSLEDAALPQPKEQLVLLLVPGIHKGVLPALQYAQSLAGEKRALYIELDPESTQRIKEKWDRWSMGIPLIVVESPYRKVIEPVLDYLDVVQETEADRLMTIVIPEFVPQRWWEHMLHNQTGLRLKLALLNRPGVVVTNVRYYLAPPRKYGLFEARTPSSPPPPSEGS